MQLRLADFIDANSQVIVDQATQVASSFSSRSAGVNTDAMREQLPQILDAIVRDLRTTQSRAEAVQRSRTPVMAPATPSSAAGTYARLRAQSGITLEQVVSELRALRSCVLLLWSDAAPDGDDALEDVVRFNEAVDQILAESIANFSAEIEGWRNVFLGTLAHDLRGPLSVNLLAAEVLSRITPDGPARPLVDRMTRSATRIKALLDSLLDYSKASLGRGIRVSPVEADLDAELRDEIELLQALFPEHEVAYESGGRTTAIVDASRIREAVANLVINAAKHGAPNGRIRVVLSADRSGLTLAVENFGPTVPDETLSGLFMPFGHMREEGNSPQTDSLGLGLFIVKQIATAHGGSVSVSSGEGRTTFVLKLPTEAEAPRDL